MKIVIEEKSYGWYAMTEGDAPQPYNGLLVGGNSMDDVLEKLPGALKELREAFLLKTAEGDK